MSVAPPNAHRPLPRGRLLTAAALLALGLWAYAPTVAALAGRWGSDPQYSHGWLVPVFALALLYLHRGMLADVEPGFSWLGVGLLAVAGLMRLPAADLNIDWVEAASLLLSLAGLAALVGGWTGLRWAGPPLLFALFMVPLPFRLETALAGPLQSAATAASTYALQTVGVSAFAEGNVIVVDDARWNVAEACSGLSMMMTFLALCTGAAMLLKRPLPDRLILVASAVPIALAANVARITATGVLYELFGRRVAAAVFHDLAGWLMMPLALLLLWLVVRLLDAVLVPDERTVVRAFPSPYRTA